MKPARHPTRTVAVVLAAGLGTRMKSSLPKVLHELCGRPMLAYVLDAVTSATDLRPLVVYSPPTAAVRDAFAGTADFVLQDEPRGTGDAVRAAVAALPAGAGEALVVYGDVPLMEAQLLDSILAARRDADAAVAIVTVVTLDPGRLGRIVRDGDGMVERIVEAKDATDDELEIDEINAGIYAFDSAWLQARIADLRPSPATGELYLTDLIGLARADGRAVADVEVVDDGTLAGINDRAQLADASFRMRERINDDLLLAGVTMLDPTTAHIDAGVEIEPDVVLEPNVVLRGRTRIGGGTRIGAGSQIVDTVVGRDCRIWASVLESSLVEDGVSIGPFSHLRSGSSIGPGAVIGNYAEVKNSRLERGVKQHHMSYLGDADVGAETNVGAGTITANYDGVRKHRTTIGERVFLGVDTMLRAPVTLGDGAKTGAGAVVTRDVPAGKLAVGVPARIREPRTMTAPGEAAEAGEANSGNAGSTPADQPPGARTAESTPPAEGEPAPTGSAAPRRDR